MLAPLSLEESKQLFFEIIQGQDSGKPKNIKEDKSKKNKDVSKDSKVDSRTTSEEVAIKKESKQSEESKITNDNSKNIKGKSQDTGGGESKNIKESNDMIEESKNNNGSKDFTKIKEDIIRNCGGLPLAIVVVAGLLARRDLNNVNHWETVKESLNSELDKNLTPEGMAHILNLCYNDLPADQKNCLLYLSIFPKGCSINSRA